MENCNILIPKNKIVKTLTNHVGEQIDIGLIMNLLVEMETEK